MEVCTTCTAPQVSNKDFCILCGNSEEFEDFDKFAVCPAVEFEISQPILDIKIEKV